MTDIEQNLFHEFLRTFNTAADQGFSKSVDPDDDFRQAIRHSNAVFSAFKTHRMQNDMAARLLDENGDLKPFEQWKKDVRSIASHQCGAWLRTEYDTAVIRARQAADWKQFERERDVLPNLKWLPSTSLHPGEDHRPFWGTILPIDHPFWSQHRPGDRWNCKCDLTSTDEPPTPVPSVAVSQQPANSPHRGLDNNPGTDGKLFADSHPYVANAYPGAKEAVEKVVRTLEIKETKLSLRKAVQGKMANNKKFGHDILVSRASIDEWVNQPFKYPDEKILMLYDILDVIWKAEYLGPADKHKDIDRLVQSHIFWIAVKDIDAYIIVHEYNDGKYILHSISDSQNILKYLKSK
ncbi:MAG: hypothetical protein IJJ56_02325 [Prevotella sp.]|nr:hypothetical protein [Prevotella sp.]